MTRSHSLIRAARGAIVSLAGVLLAALLAAPLSAQPPGGGPGGPGGPRGMGGPGRMQAMLMEGITLDTAQRVKIDSINAAYMTRREAARAAAPAGPPDSATMAARRTEMRSQRDAIRAQLRPDQQKTFDANVQRMEARMRERAGAGGPPGGRR